MASAKTEDTDPPIACSRECVCVFSLAPLAGKSTACNTLTNTTLFKESDKSVSETTTYKKESVDVGDMRFIIVDTMGIGDTGHNVQEVMFKIADACHAVKDGLHQVLFVVGKRFTEVTHTPFATPAPVWSVAHKQTIHGMKALSACLLACVAFACVRRRSPRTRS